MAEAYVIECHDSGDVEAVSVSLDKARAEQEAQRLTDAYGDAYGSPSRGLRRVWYQAREVNLVE